jgi:hypothetical protein
MFGVRALLSDRVRELVLETLIAERLRFAEVGRADPEHRHRLLVPLVVEGWEDRFTRRPNRADERAVGMYMTYTRFLPLLMAALFIVLFVAACGGKGGGY